MGSSYDFGSRLVGGLDRSFLDKGVRFGKNKGPNQKAVLVDAKDRSGMYFVDYTLEMPGEFSRHLLSVVALGNNGRYNRLYTVTAQADAENYSAVKKTLMDVVESFKLLKS
mmetsp:Transcript_32571/g.39415  ORF Transcript_32571/g.39415 Transcript_32571/m.39415 type:complete len:111 (-) Transcript_32571:152-484(-)